jgi:pimeloyl-ACP methyl ester carboxylesterase
MKKIIRFIIPILILTTQSACFRFRITDKEAFENFGALPYNFQIHRYKIGSNRTMRYLEIGRDSQPVVVFLHGGIGTSSGFKAYMHDTALLNHYKIIVPDRYGHGFSDFGKTEVSVQKQADYLLPILKKARYVGTKTILVGHSYGGTIAARMAMDNPQLIDNLVLSAPAIDPNNEKKFWFNKPLDWWFLKWMMPRNFIIANDEKLSHAKECAKMEADWHKITTPTVYIHGKNDDVVPFVNIEFAKKHLVNAPTEYIVKDSLPHIFFMHNPEILRGIIINCH